MYFDIICTLTYIHYSEFKHTTDKKSRIVLCNDPDMTTHDEVLKVMVHLLHHLCGSCM